LPPRPDQASAVDPVEGWLAGEGPCGILSDFDGTLAPIVEDPAAAVPVPGALGALGALAERAALVAVVSGRPVAFLAERLAPLADRLVLAGLYGLQRLERGQLRVEPAVAAWEPVVADVAVAARSEAPAGVGVEDKGLTVTLHVRRRPELLGWVEDWSARASQRSGLQAEAGKLSVELRPPVAIDKGTVVDELSEPLAAVCYLGDDRGDLAAFAALARQRRAGRPRRLAVAVGGTETPPEVLAAADLDVDGPVGAVRLLWRIATCLGG
jgi:trehalose 6-phosphate phosphatase